jgi:hypothetical protein
MHLDCHALPADLRLSHGNVARPRNILARAGTQPLREANRRRFQLVFVAKLLLAFTHEGALVLLLAIVATLAPRGLRSTPFVRGRDLPDHNPDSGHDIELRLSTR